MIMIIKKENYEIAWNEDLSLVKEFITNYANFKDKLGLSGTTLLYLASIIKHMYVVKYLVETANYSINVQNGQDLEKSLLTLTSISLKNTDFNLSAASSALRGTCFNGYLNVKHSVDYSIKNQTDETPMMNEQYHAHITEFFRNLIVSEYSTNLNIFREKKQCIVDCILKYKSFHDNIWYSFSAIESNELHQSLIVKSDEQFQYEILLKVFTGVCTVSTVEFLRSGRNSNPENNVA
ncbi:unnamed protein product [Rotaria sordida]|uniref:Ankyrin repeat protein n=2 Tax=Rotaria sordida TaxID=392033 RepID=A0A819K7P6_9BILA|nr:unnamed protein product [Rotaria sordida]